MVFLEACTLIDLKGLYNWEKFRIDQYQLEDIIQLVHQRYDQGIGHVLQQMLSRDPSYRIEAPFLLEYILQLQENFHNNIEEKQFSQVPMTMKTLKTESIINNLNNTIINQSFENRKNLTLNTSDLSVDYYQKRENRYLTNQKVVAYDYCPTNYHQKYPQNQTIQVLQNTQVPPQVNEWSFTNMPRCRFSGYQNSSSLLDDHEREALYESKTVFQDIRPNAQHPPSLNYNNLIVNNNQNAIRDSYNPALQQNLSEDASLLSSSKV